MSKVSTWMPMYVSDYLRDTAHLTITEHGAYTMLLYHSWTLGPLANDESRLARLCKMDVKTWRKIAPEVLAFFSVVDGKLIQKRLEAERKRAEELSEKRRQAGMQRGNKTEANDPSDGGNSPPDAEQMSSNSSANGHAIAAQKQTHAGVARPSPSHPPSSEESSNPPSLRSVPPKRRERLRDDWAPSEAGEKFAEDHGVDARNEAQKFRNHHTAKGSLMADWDAAWRTWCGNAQRFAPRAKPIPGQSPLDLMIRAERMAAAREETSTDYPRITAH